MSLLFSLSQLQSAPDPFVTFEGGKVEHHETPTDDSLAAFEKCSHIDFLFSCAHRKVRSGYFLILEN